MYLITKYCTFVLKLYIMEMTQYEPCPTSCTLLYYVHNGVQSGLLVPVGWLVLSTAFNCKLQVCVPVCIHSINCDTLHIIYIYIYTHTHKCNCFILFLLQT